ncbi:DUF445 domain-containing protein [Massilia arenosa]|uniref:DUF445 domain-containing protein n=1 Tax=Zemynaea arenosa TaxID=2561931 RepID=A0A4Y9SG29_9BURK|nr:DUF445 family protein [Massilia arenosa]TFW20171.1 DUF445 domain-containing protein [Massilia arenosa]
MDKMEELKRAKRYPLLLLAGAALVFIGASLMPRGLAVDCVRTTAEAAMVGALADWFAVVALFRRVPLPLVSRHTAIIPQNQERIADNLAVFVQEKFLDQRSLVELIRRHDPAGKLTEWLSSPAHTATLGHYVLRIVSGVLDVVDDQRIQGFLRQSFRAVIDKVDLAPASAAILDTLTRDGRHQQLLDGAIEQVVTLLRTEESRAFIARQIVEWIRTDYPKWEKLLPTEYLGEKAADAVAQALDGMLQRVSADPEHELRKGFDGLMARLIEKLKTDPATIAKAEELKAWLRDSEAARDYAVTLWTDLRDWLRQDIASEDSSLHRNVVAMGAWIGRELAANPDLRRSLNDHMEDAARSMAPDFADFLTRHISDTVKRWDPQDLSRQVELNIGKDLQYIRINGTLVGGCVGLLLFWVSWLLGAAGGH